MWEEKNLETGRVDYWDVMKGIGIISIVLGHSCFWAGRWVYMYHLAVFFFISGFLYNSTKWGDKPFLYVGAKLGNVLPKFMIYSTFLLALNNILVNVGIYSGMPIMRSGDLLTGAIGTMFFAYTQLGGALWFVPVLVIACGIFAVIIYICLQLRTCLKYSEWIFKVTVIVFSCIIGNIGILYNLAKYELPYHSHTSLLMLPIICAAWLVRESKRNLEAMVNLGGAVLCGSFIFYIVQIRNQSIELAKEEIIGPYMFYIVSFLGIYLCMYLTKLICKTRILRRSIAFLGSYSFEIMAFHFLVFKIIDLIVTKLLNEDISFISAFPTGYADLWPLYLIFGCFIPSGFIWIIGYLKKRII